MDCLFCSIIAGDIPSRRVADDQTGIAFLDVAPFQDGHTLVVPRRHVRDLLSNDGELARITPLVTKVSQLLVDRLGAQGINIVSNVGEVAGQSVFHLHVHLIPRYEAEPGFDAMRSRRPLRDPAEVLAQIQG
ncbi:HIT family protein [Acidipropionibacterium jensenii]|uniref:Purine nucleoside phosphoramidase n=1 Tax=Acidipropionibacterium jensenii TaxID=1749 RepID=A0A3T0S7T7_9ACTN|nr:HIT family protein [Acidipropionibacterium jensenii]QCV88673.1 HIT family protein [Acidipropionibacterium jensenii]VEI02830.1 purine nucleoside phosphoramidase [Acidipropionibacterium jensenii]